MKDDRTLKGTYCFSTLLRCGLALMFLIPSLGKAAVEGVPCTSEPTDMIVQYGDLVNCQIDAIGDLDIFRFSGAAGEAIRVLISKLAGDGIPVFDVFAPDGSLLCSRPTTLPITAPSGAADCQLTSSGTYSIRANEFFVDQTVSYSLSFERRAPPSVAAQPIDHGQIISSEIDGVGDIDAFFFEGEADDKVTIQISRASGNGIPVFDMFSPDGVLICSRPITLPIPAPAGATDCQLTQRGSHTILAREFQDNQTVKYNLTVECIIGVCPDPPVPPDPPVELEPATPQAPIDCTTNFRCLVPSICNLPESQGTACSNRVDLFVRRAAARFTDVAPRRAPRKIRFAFGVANIPPGIGNVRLTLTKKGREIVRRSKKRRLKGFLEIRNTPGTALDRTAVRVKLGRR